MKEYSFLNMSVLVNGVELTGWAEGDDVIQAERLEDSVSHVVGADGEMSLALNANRSGQFTFRLQQTSDSNLLLSQLINAAEALGSSAIVTVQTTDVVTGDLAAGSKGYITRPANMARGTGTNPQEWVLVVENMFIAMGVSALEL